MLQGPLYDNRNFREMEFNNVVFIVAIIVIATDRCMLVDGVFCFNCVSTQHPGCEEHLNLPLLVKSASDSTTPKHKRQAEVHPMEFDNHYKNNLRKGDISDVDPMTHSSKNNVINQSKDFDPNHNDVTTELRIDLPVDEIHANRSFNNNDVNMTGFINGSTRTNSTPVQVDIMSNANSKGVVDYFQTTTLAAADIKGRGQDKYGETGRGNSPASHLMIECAGNTCLTQRIQTTTGNVFVRTCDVSNGVPVNQCHLVTNVLGASVSVVCVCKGHFCNENKASGTSMIGTRLEFSNIHLVWMVMVVALQLCLDVTGCLTRW